jgi:hypothetical protein
MQLAINQPETDAPDVDDQPVGVAGQLLAQPAGVSSVRV